MAQTLEKADLDLIGDHRALEPFDNKACPFLGVHDVRFFSQNVYLG